MADLEGRCFNPLKKSMFLHSLGQKQPLNNLKASKNMPLLTIDNGGSSIVGRNNLMTLLVSLPKRRAANFTSGPASLDRELKGLVLVLKTLSAENAS